MNMRKQKSLSARHPGSIPGARNLLICKLFRITRQQRGSATLGFICALGVSIIFSLVMIASAGVRLSDEGVCILTSLGVSLILCPVGIYGGAALTRMRKE